MELLTAHAPNKFFFLLSILICGVSLVRGAPSLEATPLEPLLAVAGESVLIDCVVRSLTNYTIIWRRVVPGSNKTEILSAGEVRIIPDPRFSLLHQKGHDTWVLQIRKAQVNDSGRYICEVNTTPRMQIFRLLSVLERTVPLNKGFAPDHNYTSCCVRAGVPTSCNSFCSLQSVVLSSHPDPWACVDHLPAIARCLTDGRDHRPCCVRQGVPEECDSVCGGGYELHSLLQHFSCAKHAVPTLACIAEGLETLPGPPLEVSAMATSPTEVQVRWEAPTQAVPLDRYVINITHIMRLTDKKIEEESHTTSENTDIVLYAEANATSRLVSGLQPSTLYEVRVRSENGRGSSLPAAALRVLTPREDEGPPSPSDDDVTPMGQLPNVTHCCREEGVPEGVCLDTLCDPAYDSDTKMSEVLRCMPYAMHAFECMSGKADHSACCTQRGLPDLCLDFCRGNVSQVSSDKYACLEHMDVYGNCLLEHYRVLPGPPLDFFVTLVRERYAVARWTPPTMLPETVQAYTVYWKEASSEEVTDFNVVPDAQSPFLLDGLEPATRYEVYAVSRNELGASRDSSHAVFTTRPLQQERDLQLQRSPAAYNETACCEAAGLRPACMPLCDYHVRVSEVRLLWAACAGQLEVLARCGAGGRDHGPCCLRRGVAGLCQPLCRGQVDMSPQRLVAKCIHDVGSVIQCMSEGVGVLPEPPLELRALSVLPTRIQLKWAYDANDNDSVNKTRKVWFEVRYSQVGDGVPPHPLDYDNVVNTTEKELALKELQANATYSAYVVSANEFGYSLPSLVLVVHTPLRELIYNETFDATLGPAQSLEVTQQTTTSVTLVWRPPFHAPAKSRLTYLLLYRPANDSSGSMDDAQGRLAVTTTEATLSNLSVNTQYAVAVRVLSGRQESPLSETVLAWTDPAIPAFVNPPVILPPEKPLLEGSNVTVLCVAEGTPPPEVSLFLNGRLALRQQHSHLALAVPSVRRNLTRVDCFADNGLGQGASSSAFVDVSFQPQVEATAKRVPAEEGSSATVRCLVSGNPAPRVLWFRDRKLRQPLAKGSDFDLSIEPHDEEVYTQVATLTVPRVQPSHEGQYFCHAENQFGSDTVFVNLDVLPTTYSNASACCVEKGVSAECREACGADIDLGMALNKPNCFQELDKLMYCAADGSDHRKCCRERGIQRSCLRWCQGRPIVNTQLCVLHAAKTIVACFEEGRAVLPGPPQNVQWRAVDKDLEITWDAPHKNPKVVQWYRILWRPVNARSANKQEQTKGRSLVLRELQAGVSYEVVVKAGNHHGVSLHSPPLLFTVTGIDGNGHIIAQSAAYGTSVAKTTAAVIGTFLFVFLVGGLAIFFYQRSRPKLPPGIQPGVSFENPTYMKDTNPQVSNGSPSIPEEPEVHINGDIKPEVQA